MVGQWDMGSPSLRQVNLQTTSLAEWYPCDEALTEMSKAPAVDNKRDVAHSPSPTSPPSLSVSPVSPRSPRSPPTERYLWCTLVMLNDSYVPGALVTAASVHRHSRYPIRCMCTPPTPRYPSLTGVSRGAIATLRRHFDDVTEVNYIVGHVAEEQRSDQQQVLYGRWMRYSFTKWHVLDPRLFGQYEKVIFIDADCILLDNVDELFDLDAPALTLSSPWGRSSPYGELEHGQIVDSRSLRDGLKNSFVGIGNMVLLSPSQVTWSRLKSILAEYSGRAYGHAHCWSGADEQILAEICLCLDLTVRHIHQRFNWIVGKHDWLPQSQAKTFHYHGGKKPWDYRRTERMEWPDLEEWWKLADDLMGKDPSCARWFKR